MLTPEQAEFSAVCFEKWLRIKDEVKNWEEKQQCFGPVTINLADPSHSALLRRLLNGQEPLYKPPPRRYSYPCYDLGEGKEVQVHEVWEREDIDYLKGKVVIDQSRSWQWIEKGKVLIHDNGDIFSFNAEKKQLKMTSTELIFERLKYDGTDDELLAMLSAAGAKPEKLEHRRYVATVPVEAVAGLQKIARITWEPAHVRKKEKI